MDYNNLDNNVLIIAVVSVISAVAMMILSRNISMCLSRLVIISLFVALLQWLVVYHNFGGYTKYVMIICVALEIISWILYIFSYSRYMF